MQTTTSDTKTLITTVSEREANVLLWFRLLSEREREVFFDQIDNRADYPAFALALDAATAKDCA